MSSSITFMNTNWDQCYQKGTKYLRLNQMLFDLIIRKVLQNLQKDTLSYAIDLGCGRGELAAQLSCVSKFVWGGDGSKVALDSARSQKIANAKFFEMNLNNLEDFSQTYNNHFDAIFCKLTFPFIKNKEDFLRKCNEMLVDRGALVIITPIQLKGIEYHGKDAKISFSHEKLMKMLKATYDNTICLNKSYYAKNSVIGSYIAFK